MDVSKPHNKVDARHTRKERLLPYLSECSPTLLAARVSTAKRPSLFRPQQATSFVSSSSTHMWEDVTKDKLSGSDGCSSKPLRPLACLYGVQCSLFVLLGGGGLLGPFGGKVGAGAALVPSGAVHKLWHGPAWGRSCDHYWPVGRSRAKHRSVETKTHRCFQGRKPRRHVQVSVASSGSHTGPTGYPRFYSLPWGWTQRWPQIGNELVSQVPSFVPWAPAGMQTDVAKHQRSTRGTNTEAQHCAQVSHKLKL